MNEWRGRGGLTKDPEYADMNGMMRANFTVAVNGTRYDRQRREQVVKTTFVSCEAWGVVAERLYSQGVGKGCEVMVVGELTQWKKEGEERAHTRIACFDVVATRMTARAQAAPQPVDQPPADDPWGGGR